MGELVGEEVGGFVGAVVIVDVTLIVLIMVSPIFIVGVEVGEYVVGLEVGDDDDVVVGFVGLLLETGFSSGSIAGIAVGDLVVGVGLKTGISVPRLSPLKTKKKGITVFTRRIVLENWDELTI